MARLRKFCSYRRVKRPYTRVSKYEKKNYIKVTSPKIIIEFVMGNQQKKFTHCFELISKEELQIRENAIESARQSANKLLETHVGSSNYLFRINVFPHHVMRENPLASGAGADRLSTGMAAPFGKPIGHAAQIRKNQRIMSVFVNQTNMKTAKLAMKRALNKLPGGYLIKVSELPKSS